MPERLNNIDWNTTAAWIALAISIITPSISLLLNNVHQLKLKRLELQHNKGIEQYHQCQKSYENFIVQASSHLYNLGGNKIDYERAYQNLFLYVPPVHWDILKKLDSEINSASHSKGESCPTYGAVIEILASLLQEQQKQIPV